MQVKNRWWKLLLVLCFTGLALLLLTMQQLLGKQRDETTIPMPENALWSLQVNAVEFWQAGTYEVLFESKDEQILQQLRQEIQTQRETRTDKGSLGIDPHTDVIITAFPLEKEVLMVYTIQLIDPEMFEKSLGSYLTKNSVGTVIGQNGIVITGTKNTSNKTLQKAINQWKKAPQLKRSDIVRNQTDYISFKQWKQAQNGLVQKVTFGVERKDQTLSLSGTCLFSDERISPLNYDLQAQGFYLSSRVIPAHLKDTLNKYLPLGDFEFTDITGIVMDYQGVYLEEAKANLPEVFGYLPIPKINLIIQSKQDLSVEKIMAACPENIRASANTLNFGETDYQLVQLDAKTIFIGLDPSRVKKRAQTNLFTISGKLESLLHVDGSGFMTAMIQNLGPIKKGKQFLNTTEKISFQVSRSMNNTYLMNGEVVFKEGRYPLTEITRLFLSLN